MRGFLVCTGSVPEFVQHSEAHEKPPVSPAIEEEEVEEGEEEEEEEEDS